VKEKTRSGGRGRKGGDAKRGGGKLTREIESGGEAYKQDRGEQKQEELGGGGLGEAAGGLTGTNEGLTPYMKKCAFQVDRRNLGGF